MGRPALCWKSVSAWRRVIHHSHSRPIRVLVLTSSPCCYMTAFSLFLLLLLFLSLSHTHTHNILLSPPHISVVLSHHLSLADRRADGRLSRARNAPFLFFTSPCSGKEWGCGRIPPPPQVSVLFFPSWSRWNKTAATVKIDASRCKFVLFFMVGHPAAPCLTLPCLASP